MNFFFSKSTLSNFFPIFFLLLKISELTSFKQKPSQEIQLRQSSIILKEQTNQEALDLEITFHLESLTLTLYHGLEAKLALLRVTKINGNVVVQNQSISQVNID